MDCLTWDDARDKDGYGVFKLAGKQWRTHRYVMHKMGHDIENKMVLHKCDNPSCYRPDHLYVGTAKDNTLDMMRRGRGVDNRGSKHGMSKLTEEDVRLIKSSSMSGVATAKKFGVSKTTISEIRSGKHWAHVK